MSRFFYDTEFLEGKQKEKFPMSLFRKETKPTIDLISIGMFSDDERYYYAVSKDFNLKEAWNRYDVKVEQMSGDMRNIYPNGKKVKVYWIRENVLKPIFKEFYVKERGLSLLIGNDFEELWRKKPFSCRGWLKILINKYGKTNDQIAVDIKEFTNVIARDKFDNSYVTGEKVELYGYYSAYDHVVISWLFGKMIDLPDGFPMFTIDLKQELYNYIAKTWKDVEMSTWGHEGITLDKLKSHPNYPKQDNAHNALDDAIFNRNLYNFLKTL